MNHLDACAGLGGFALGLQTAGLRFSWHGYSEIDKACEEAYARHYPTAVRLGDLARWREWGLAPGWLDIFSAGFPCPPFSVAGKRLGGDDPRNLWPVVADAIRGLRPRYAILENVCGLLHGKPGRPAYFGRVLGDLAEAGYDAEWEVLSAREVGASHRRERVFVVAHDNRRSRRSTFRASDIERRTGASSGDGKQPAVSRRAGRRTDNEGEREAGRGRLADAGKYVADAALDGQPRSGRTWPGRTGLADASLPLFPPGPADAEGWRRVLARWPELAPALSQRDVFDIAARIIGTAGDWRSRAEWRNAIQKAFRSAIH